MAIRSPQNGSELLGCLLSFLLYRLFLGLGIVGFVGGVMLIVFAIEEGELSLLVVAISGGALVFGSFFTGLFVDAWRKRNFSLGWKLPLIVFLFSWLAAVILGWSLFYGELPGWVMLLLTVCLPIAFFFALRIFRKNNLARDRSTTYSQGVHKFKSRETLHR
ncbi:hypothetical protein K8R78_06825 [bacterium]|nr:hypothetical protein [bacterium]